MMEIGLMIRLMVEELISRQMGLDLKASGLTINRMDLVLKYGLMDLSMREHT